MGKRKIGILIFYPFQYYVHKNIYKSLKEMGVDVNFIIDPTGSFPVRPEKDTVEKTRWLLTKEQVDFVEFEFDNFFSEDLRNLFLQDYTALVSTWHRGLIFVSKNQRKVCVQYGAGKELTTLGLWKRKFDLCLAYGDYSHSFYSQLTQSASIGNPKFDDWFSKNFDHDLIKEINSKLDSKKKTILYLPTHSDLSSINELAETLKKNTDSYNIIVKLHYYNLQEDADSVKKLNHKHIILLDDSVDLLSLLHISDVVLSDNSSAIFDALLADKPVVVTDFHNEEYLDRNHRASKIYRRGFGSALTYSNSIEQRIKKDGTVVTIKNINDFNEAVEQTLLDPNNIREKRKTLTKKLFKHQDVHSGRRGAEAVLKLLDLKELPPKTFLSNAIDFFEIETIRKNFFAREVTEVGEDALLDSKDICFVIYDEGNNADDVIKTLLSLSPSSIKNLYIFTNNSEQVLIRIKGLYAEVENLHFISGETIGVTLTKVSATFEKIIFMYAGCIFITPGYLNKIEHKLLYKHTTLMCAYVYKNKAIKSNWDKLSDLELRQSAGYTHYHVNLHTSNFFEIKNSLWDNPVNEPRFFIFDTKVIKNGEILISNLIHPYKILLFLKNYYSNRNISTTFYPLQIIDLNKRTGDIFYKKKIKIVTEKVLGRGGGDIKKHISLIWVTLSLPFNRILLFPYACIILIRVILTYFYVLLFFYLKKHTILKNN